MSDGEVVEPVTVKELEAFHASLLMWQQLAEKQKAYEGPWQDITFSLKNVRNNVATLIGAAVLAHSKSVGGGNPMAPNMMLLAQSNS